MSLAHRTTVLALVAACAVLAPATAGHATAQPQPPSPARIVIENFGFTPAVLKVSPGQKVTVVNRDDAPHTVTADGPATFNTGTITAGGTKTFTAPLRHGSHPYFCNIHQFMAGRLDVR
ncbi:hypothetical protein GCM10010329_77390 [Streptomyces spiroverticillatus]|uniref:EfeO-type cupredoxin-like domain-containing protein n=1 Tax=Streptomyces finlayi TaxID=67296 RepID=A0A919CET3_9ACTN|nr:cupredoxin domain-containing protein [Streptomyces finlayi]GHA42985.1 hypothetical protein GCM10010329_77390 [Streptomyces spiroverticillatus]GHD13971.1 hypothetical protein GCM10010334_72800 [Streptomyces finlayi]